MIEIAGAPILWHIMKSYSHYGHNEFIICCGYRGYVIKQFFADYYLHRSDITFDFTQGNAATIHNNEAEPWKVTLVDTGLDTMTGGRIKRIQQYVGDEPFLMTYGDGVSDVNINEMIAFHQARGKVATLLAYQPGGRFGVLNIGNDATILNFSEKTKESGGWINAGFMVLNPEIFDLIEGDATVFEKRPLEECARRGQLNAYCHDGFWQCMDTLRDKLLLEDLIASGRAPWIKW